MAIEHSVSLIEDSVSGLRGSYGITLSNGDTLMTAEVTNGGSLSSPLGGGTSITIKNEGGSTHELVVRPPIRDQALLTQTIGNFAAFVSAELE